MFLQRGSNKRQQSQNHPEIVHDDPYVGAKLLSQNVTMLLNFPVFDFLTFTLKRFLLIFNIFK